MVSSREHEGRESDQLVEGLNAEPAHVLFMDIVEYSVRPMKDQHRAVNRLKEIVRNAPSVIKTTASRQSLILFTGDGMALSFFGEPLVALECARQIARSVQAETDFKLRMGLHSGPVYRIEDINANQNVAGGGINISQRVMDCGDAGHILMSNTYADYLIQLGEWASHLSDLGECPVKHGLKLHLFSFQDGQIGNAEIPRRLLQTRTASRRRAAKWTIIAAILCAFIMVAVATIIFRPKFLFSQREVTSNGSSPVATARYALSYSIMVQTYQNNEAVGEPIEVYQDLDKGLLLQNNQRIRLRFTSMLTGHLYLLSESSGTSNNGPPSYNVLFPSTEDNKASALIVGGRLKIVPRMEDPSLGFYGNSGTDKIWIIWSTDPIDALEDVKRLNNPKEMGRIQDARQRQNINALLSDDDNATLATEPDEATHSMKLTFSENVLVRPIVIEHR